MSITSLSSSASSIREAMIVPSQLTTATTIISLRARIRKIWSNLNNSLRENITNYVIRIALFAAYRPKLNILFVLFLTLSLFTTGIVTNFNVNVDFEFLFTPSGTRTADQIEWFRTGERNPNDRNVNRVLPNSFLQQKQQEEDRQNESNNLAAFVVEEKEEKEENKEGGKRERQRQRGMRSKDYTDLQHQYRNILDSFSGSSSSSGTFSDSSSWMLLKSPNNYQHNNQKDMQGQQLNRGRNAQQQEQNVTSEEYLRPFNINFVLLFVVHAKGANVLTMEGLKRSNMVIDTIKQAPGYDQICRGGLYPGRPNGCLTYGVNTLWGSDFLSLVDDNEDVEKTQDENDDNAPQSVMELLSKINNAGVMHDIPSYLGGIERDPQTKNVTSAKAFFHIALFPYNTRHQSFTDQFEKQLLEELSTLKQQWSFEDGGNDFGIEGMTNNGVKNGLMNSIVHDLPLIGAVFLVMITFTAIIFFKVDRIQSRSLLGLGGVATIVLSLMSGFGVLFMVGIPFTPMTMVIPFLMFGVGLDDKFVILCAYNRTTSQSNSSSSSNDKNEEEKLNINNEMYYCGDVIDNFIMNRIHAMIEEVSISVVATTASTTLSFLLGITSTIPAIKWVCYYAAPCVLFDFFYQMTFFIALIALDERRNQSNRVECSFACCYNDDHHDDHHDEDQQHNINDHMDNTMDSISDSISQFFVVEKHQQYPHRKIHKTGNGKGVGKGIDTINHQCHADENTVASRFMKWYADKLMLLPVRYTVLFVFVAFFGFATYRASLMEQHFNATSMLPRSSPVNGYLEKMAEYSTRLVGPDIVFRYVDQANPIVQDQMIDMIEQIRNIPGFGEHPPACWVLVYKEIMDQIPEMLQSQLRTMTIREQIEFGKLMFPDRETEFAIFEVLLDQFTWTNDQGKIVASTCRIYATDLNVESANETMEIFKRIKEIERNHPMNTGVSNANEYPFFTNEFTWYPIWELLLKTLPEMTCTVLFAVAAVLFVGFMIIPHYSGIIFLVITVMMLLVDLIGVMQLIGVKINPISYVSLVISIGLMVDYIVHILIRYYECIRYLNPINKVKDTLQTIGVSVLVGGLSTLLGFFPMIFSTANVFITFSYTLVSMVLLSLLHGLVFLPVLLSFFGPSSSRDGQEGMIHFEDEDECKQEKWIEGQQCKEALPLSAALSIGTFDMSVGDTANNVRLVEF